MNFFKILYELKSYIKISLYSVILACISFTLYAEEYTGRLSMHWNDKHHCTKHAQMFVDEVFEKSDGRIKIEVFHSGQLFGIREIMAGVTSGNKTFDKIIQHNIKLWIFPKEMESWITTTNP